MVLRRRSGGEQGGGAGGGGGGHNTGAARWMVSYADFITLLMITFTVLFSMARVDMEKYGNLAASLRYALGRAGPVLGPIPAAGIEGTPMPILPPERPGYLPDIPDWPAHLVGPPPESPADVPPVPEEPPPPTAQPSENPEDSTTWEPSAPAEEPADELAELEAALRSLPGYRSGLLAVALEQSGVKLSIAGRILFDPGQTELKPSATQILDEIIPTLSDVLIPIWVYGTADEEPVEGAPAPEYLAAVRSATVINYFRNHGLDSKEFVNISYTGGVQDDYRVSIVVQRRE